MSEGELLHVGILAREFLGNIGANDFLRNVIRGLGQRPGTKITFLCPRSNEKVEMIASAHLKERLKRIPFLKTVTRSVMRYAGPITDRIFPQDPDEYAFYAEVCERMEFVTSETDAQSLIRLKEEQGIDVLLPSVQVLPSEIPYVTYWPDCQPKYFPEFFDDASQKVRDERIFALLATGRPMIVNSRDAKSDIVKFYKADPDQVFALPFAPIIEPEKIIPRQELLAKYELPPKYFLICNQFWVHKSIETVIEAAALAKGQGLKVDFVFTGRMEEPRRPGYIKSLRQLVVDRGVSDIVHFLDYIPKDDQLELMKGCVAVVQPTLFEGGPGGGAVHDAISLGVRAVVSDIPINYELPLESSVVETFKRKDPADLVKKLRVMLNTPYNKPSPESLHQQSKRSTESLCGELYRAIGYAIKRGNYS
ncbi:glycosyltransferase [Shinella sedimenti]|uniref:Glycosyltransferase n=1 Tax=Shinella sedimenti TaxID=2919913 RepID=A0ABT0CS21_9HYPH|nr:glycosyltransferase [Shinella sedimenti]MCJ8151396.1 glycosyltransferase [Shinella sedimenti]